MNFLSQYRTYLNDNPEHFWFKRKIYGWGWVPATWKGWVSVVFFLVVFAFFYVPFVTNDHIENNDVIIFLVEIAAWAAGLIGLCLVTGESPHWQWGMPEESTKDTL